MSETKPHRGDAHPARPVPGAVPDGPGVYQFYAADGRVLYVGKAKHLSSRVMSYFRDPSELHDRTRRMLTEAAGVRWTVCSSEIEALVLESNWIRGMQPPYNVLLRDGSGYPRLALTVNETVPRLLPWRGDQRKGIQYFGPYPHIRMRTLMDALTRVFPVRSCKDSVYKRAQLTNRPCLLADLSRCSAPCVGRVTVEEHRATVDELRSFLDGGSSSNVALTESEMELAVSRHEYELAARLRDRLQALRAIGAGQTAQLDAKIDADAFVSSQDNFHSVFAWAVARGGQVVASGSVSYDPDPTLPTDRQLSQLIARFYLENVARFGAPKTLYVERPLNEPVAGLIGSTAGSNQPAPVAGIAPLTSAPAPAGSLLTPTPPHQSTIKVAVPRRGHGLALLGFAQRQAIEGLRQATMTRPHSIDDRHGALEELAGVIGDGRMFRRVEGIDISHTQGRSTIGGLVTFVDGVERRSEYRRLNLRTGGGDDYAALAELVTRRFSGNRLGLGVAPDLLLVDGGPGQVSSVVEAIDRLQLEDRPVICGLAKRLEELFPEGEDDPILLPRSSAAFYLVTRVRDAVHANAIGAHRRRRDRVVSELDELPGVGPARRKQLLARFGTVEAVRGASLADLQQVEGIGAAVAARIHRALHPESSRD